MKRLQSWVLMLMMVGLIGASIAVAASEPSDTAATETGKPHAVFTEVKYVFDAVVDGTQVTHDFKIKNEGDAELTIHRVKTG